MVKTTYGIIGKDIGVSDKNCGIKKIDTKHIIEYLDKGIIIIPKFQRELEEDKIDSIENEFIERHKNDENYLIKHGYTLSLCKIGNKKEIYLIDGQHRIEAMKRIYNKGYNPDIIVRIQLCSNLEQMKTDFKQLNSNSKIPILYKCFENDFIQELLLDIKQQLKVEYGSAFNKSKNINSNSNRLHLDSFLELFDLDRLNKETKTKTTLYQELIDINDEISYMLENDEEKETRYYITHADKKIIDNCGFYLSLKNIEWMERLYDSNYDFNFKPITYKKSNIPKSLSKKVYDRDVGSREYIGPCFVCTNEITRDSGHIGHIIPEYLGGETHLDNLKAICAGCNLSMGTQNLIGYKNKYFHTKNDSTYIK